MDTFNTTVSTPGFLLGVQHNFGLAFCSHCYVGSGTMPSNQYFLLNGYLTKTHLSVHQTLAQADFKTGDLYELKFWAATRSPFPPYEPNDLHVTVDAVSLFSQSPFKDGWTQFSVSFVFTALDTGPVLKFETTQPNGPDATTLVGAVSISSKTCSKTGVDVSALCDLYFATGGAGWTNKVGWETCQTSGGTATSDPCSPAWHGVTCDTTVQSYRVTEL
jgi:hypothetical protein